MMSRHFLGRAVSSRLAQQLFTFGRCSETNLSAEARRAATKFREERSKIAKNSRLKTEISTFPSLKGRISSSHYAEHFCRNLLPQWGRAAAKSAYSSDGSEIASDSMGRLLVDNGSTDGSAQIARSCWRSGPAPLRIVKEQYPNASVPGIAAFVVREFPFFLCSPH